MSRAPSVRLRWARGRWRAALIVRQGEFAIPGRISFERALSRVPRGVGHAARGARAVAIRGASIAPLLPRRHTNLVLRQVSNRVAQRGQK